MNKVIMLSSGLIIIGIRASEDWSPWLAVTWLLGMALAHMEDRLNK